MRARAVGLAFFMGLLTLSAAHLTGWPAYESAPTGTVRVDTPQVSVRNGSIDVTTRLYSSQDQTVSGWFFLASNASTGLPWQDFAYKSAVELQPVSKGGSVKFHWAEPVSLPADDYVLTLWFHQETGTESIPLDGGTFGAALVPVTPTTPIHQFYGGATIQVDSVDVSAGSPHLQATITMQAPPQVQQAILHWDLRPSGQAGASPVYVSEDQTVSFSNRSGDTATVPIVADLSLPAGAYDLWLSLESPPGQSQTGELQRAVRTDVVSQPAGGGG